jgi:hypothetical protein
MMTAARRRRAVLATGLAATALLSACAGNDGTQAAATGSSAPSS